MNRWRTQKIYELGEKARIVERSVLKIAISRKGQIKSAMVVAPGLYYGALSLDAWWIEIRCADLTDSNFIRKHGIFDAHLSSRI
ncbi:MAG: hypothetical protein QNL11_13075 [Desulfobacterales bacterium]|nr:hypothetical protein [Desulfobacterales bacterium]